VVSNVFANKPVAAPASPMLQNRNLRTIFAERPCLLPSWNLIIDQFEIYFGSQVSLGCASDFFSFKWCLLLRRLDQLEQAYVGTKCSILGGIRNV